MWTLRSYRSRGGGLHYRRGPIQYGCWQWGVVEFYLPCIIGIYVTVRHPALWACPQFWNVTKKLCACMWTNRHAVCARTHTHTYMHKHTHTNTHTHIHTYTNTHTYIHTHQSSQLSCIVWDTLNSLKSHAWTLITCIWIMISYTYLASVITHKSCGNTIW